MKKLILLFALMLTVCSTVSALIVENVKYIDDKGVEQTVSATEITNSSSTLRAGWYVVKGDNVQTGTLICDGAVHIILADFAKLEVQGYVFNAGIQVLDVSSLTIYGQAYQIGELIAIGGDLSSGIGGASENSGSNITINGGIVTATGGSFAAGIGGGKDGSGSNITINGGIVTATGGSFAAGIGGGGKDGSGSNITINGGTVTATGGFSASGIGGGADSFGSNIKVAASFIIYADNSNPPTTEILHDDNDDIALHLNGKQYAIVKKDVIYDVKKAAIDTIDTVIAEIDNENIKAIADNTKTAINAAKSVEAVNALKTQAFVAIASAKAAYGDGKAEALGEMATPCDGCSVVEVKKGEKTVTLYAPEQVNYKKITSK